MENWVDAKAITIRDYEPKLLGTTEDEAVAGFLHRIDGLIEFSKLRAQRAKPYVLADDRSSTEPIVLESALETSRVVADLLHTLGQLASWNSGSAALRGTITSIASAGLKKMPAKIMLLGTIYSTMTITINTYTENSNQQMVPIPNQITVNDIDTVASVGAGDTTNLYDSTGSNALVASGSTATFKNSTSQLTLNLNSSSSVIACQQSGTNDTASVQATDFALRLLGNWTSV
jgi:hypothetical protein